MKVKPEVKRVIKSMNNIELQNNIARNSVEAQSVVSYKLPVQSQVIQRQRSQTFNKITNLNRTNINIYSPAIFSEFPPSFQRRNTKKIRSSMDFWADSFGQKTSARKIKVFARFRPQNVMELELSESQLGGKSCIFPTVDTVVIKPENHIFTLDLVLKPDASQEQVYEYVGRQTVSDVLNGYNGTIFTYGQTGSGKTYTLVGDIISYSSKGIIIRAIEQIFDHIQNSEIGMEYVITCSILEIYKENLFDLLRNQDGQDLKIKESPTKGIYVDGLTKLSVISQEELFRAIEQGNQMKQVAQTRYNSQSSRSHTIFQIEIEQIFPNDTQKIGNLNLIDLAGSEKVSKTQVVGGRLEEAKKINLSLTYLGNCIHALTKKNSHIPFRDSKLTRLLQESLGGNYKTSLIVTCSMHSSCSNETISSLNFARRAKHIKNYVKMNIKNSREKMSYIIQQLKIDVITARNQYKRYRQFIGNKFSPDVVEGIEGEFANMNHQEMINRDNRGGNRIEIPNQMKGIKKTNSHQPPLSHREIEHLPEPSPHKRTKSVQEAYSMNFKGTKRAKSINMTEDDDVSEMQDRCAKKYRPKIGQIPELKQEDSVFRKSHQKRVMAQTQQIKGGGEEWKGEKVVGKELLMKSQESVENYTQIILQRDILQLKLSQAEAENDKTLKSSQKKDRIIKRLDQQVFELQEAESKKQPLQDTKYGDLLNQKELLDLKYDYYKTKNDQLVFSLQVIKQQISFLEVKLEKSQVFISRILEDKSNYLNMTVEQLLQKELQFYEINLSDYFNNSFNFSFEPSFKNAGQYKQKKTLQNLATTTIGYKDQTYLQNVNSFISRLNIGNPINQTMHSQTDFNLFLQNVNNNQTPFDQNDDRKLAGFLLILKHQLIQQPLPLPLLTPSRANIINSHFHSTIETLEWKQNIAQGKAVINSNKCLLYKNLNHEQKILIETVQEHLREFNVRQQNFEVDFRQMKSKIISLRGQKQKKNQARITRHFNKISHSNSKNTLTRSDSQSLLEKQTSQFIEEICESNSNFAVNQSLIEIEIFQKEKSQQVMFNIESQQQQLVDSKQVISQIFQNCTVFKQKIFNKGSSLSLVESDDSLNLQKRNSNKSDLKRRNSLSKLSSDNLYLVDNLKITEIEHLQLKICALQSELSLQQSLASQFKNVCKELQTQISYYKNVNEEAEKIVSQFTLKQNKTWTDLLNKTNEIFEAKEHTLRKQLAQFNNITSYWVTKQTFSFVVKQYNNNIRYSELQNDSKTIADFNLLKQQFSNYKKLDNFFRTMSHYETLIQQSLQEQQSSTQNKDAGKIPTKFKKEIS